jgi:uncharacterized protein YbjT (DUF2867 family)
MTTIRTTVALTGALGFVASHLIGPLQAGGARLVGVIRPGRDGTALARRGLEIRRADLADPQTMDGVFDDVGAVVHLAGLSLVAAMVPALQRADVRRTVCVSSAGVHTRLVSSGADAKRAGEKALADSDLDYVILRPSMIYGTPADRNLIRLLRWIRRAPVVPLPGGGGTLQQPVHVDDLCAAIMQALVRPTAARQAYDVGGAQALPLAEIVRISASVLGRRVWMPTLPLQAVHGIVGALRALHLPCPVRPEQVLRLQESKAVDNGAAIRDLEFKPRTFAEGIQEEARLLSEMQ